MSAQNTTPPGNQVRSKRACVISTESVKASLRLVETAATSDSTVLLLGETGTGKELIARYPRAQPTQVTRICESELHCHAHGFAGK